MYLSKTNALPILDEDNKLVGIITDADLFRYCVIKDKNEHLELGLGFDGDSWSWEGMRDFTNLYWVSSKLTLPSIKVEEVMIRDIVSVFIHSSSGLAAHKMRTHDLAQLPVIDFTSNLIGMVYDIDLTQLLI